MLDDIENLQAGRRLRDLQPAAPGRQRGAIRQPTRRYNRAMQPVGVLSMSTDLEIQSGMEIPRVIMHLPQGRRMGNEGERRSPPFSLSRFDNCRNEHGRWTRHKNSTGNIALQATSGETPKQATDPKCPSEILMRLLKPYSDKGLKAQKQTSQHGRKTDLGVSPSVFPASPWLQSNITGGCQRPTFPGCKAAARHESRRSRKSVDRQPQMVGGKGQAVGSSLGGLGSAVASAVARILVYRQQNGP